MIDQVNYWDEFEYNKLKLLCHREKVQSILDVQEGIKRYDNLPPISVELHLTNNCNLNCPWCTDKNLHGQGETLELEKLEELFRYFGQTGTGVTIEGGGEPTIHPKFKEIVEFGYSNSIDMGLITNGTVDISEHINKFKWVRVSLDSSCEEEYIIEKGKNQFNRVVSNLEKYSAHRDNRNTFLGVGYVITTRNISCIENIVLKLNDINVDYIYFRPVEEAPDITPTRSELYDLRKRLLDITEGKRIKFMLNINDRLIYDNAGLPCVAHSLTSIIHANGDVYCCEKRRHDELRLGNIYESSFDRIWCSEFKNDVTSKLLDGDCQKGCNVCRITAFNIMFANIANMNTKRFI